MNTEEKKYQEIGSSLPNATSGQLFGKPCYKGGGKAFFCFFQNSAVFKLPPDLREEALRQSGALLFDPSGKGRPMREWVQMPFEHAADWERFAKAALAHVQSA